MLEIEPNVSHMQGKIPKPCILSLFPLPPLSLSLSHDPKNLFYNWLPIAKNLLDISFFKHPEYAHDCNHQA